MPSTSAKQHRFMEAVAHGMKPMKGGPSKAVAKEFVKADSVVSKRRSNNIDPTPKKYG